MKCDGKGLRGAMKEAARSSNDWLTDGTLLMPGHRFIDAVKLRTNSLATEERCNRGRQRVLCKMGCGAQDGLGHIMQTCPALHGLRVKRHDAVLGLVAKRLADGGSELVKREPRIAGERGLLIPDLIAVTERRACVLDVQVVSDAGVKSLAEFHRWKRDKYDNPSVIRYCHILAPIDEVIFVPVTLSWRGLLYLESANRLKELFDV